MKTLEQEFHNPSAAYRGKPFWAWNGKLEEQELLRQIDVLHEMGFGGFFMHSRTGLQTEYLGEDWFRLTDACIKRAQELGMEPWIYDEDRWPSGCTGGLVTKEPPFFGKISISSSDIITLIWCCSISFILLHYYAYF